MFEHEEELNQFCSTLASKIHTKSNGRNAINLNFLKSCIAESIPGKPENYNINSLLSELRSKKETKPRFEIDTVESFFPEIFSELGDCLDRKAVASIALMSPKDIILHILVDSIDEKKVSFIDIEELMSSKTNPYSNSLYTENNTDRYDLHRTALSWLGSISNKIIDLCIKGSGIPLDTAKIPEVSDHTVRELCIILSKSPNYKDIATMINTNSKWNPEIEKSIEIDEAEAKYFLLTEFKNTHCNKKWFK